ncbi:N-acetyltransferase family protein [Streptomyces sp. Tue6028]|uniref:GNAT family N-acetyltransferase n=1 Tax=Streptomyces sp. Tue6028 TaxID=2036037 RepID=UPI003D75C4F2
METDLPDVHRLDREAFTADAYPYFALRQFFDACDDHMLVVDDNGTLTGYIMAAATKRDGSCWLLSLGVTPHKRGHGLGRLLTSELLRALREEGVRKALSVVAPGNTSALHLYRSLGFTIDPDELRPDYFGPGADRLPISLRLE